MQTSVTFRIEDQIAIVALNAPDSSVNIITAPVLAELEHVANELRDIPGLQAAVVISEKKNGFIAGADIQEIEKISSVEHATELAATGQRIFNLWAELPFPVVAAIHGHCLGGGTEFALACHYRIAAADAVLALPEVRLGIMPGWGGTQRLPRLIPLAEAINIILTGRNVSAKEAKKLGMVDRLDSKDNLLKSAIQMAKEAISAPAALQQQRSSRNKTFRTLVLEKNPVGRYMLFHWALKHILRQTRGHYPAPLRALETIRHGLRQSLPEGLKLEARNLGRLAVTPECKNLIHVFNLSQRPKKSTSGDSAPQVNRAAVVGAGVMGGGIAYQLASRNIPVIMKDIRDEAVIAGMTHARTLFSKKLAPKGGDSTQVEEKMHLLTGTTSYDGFDGVDLVIEAVLEKMPVKQGVLQEVEPLLRNDAMFATNTSALSITELQAVAHRPERVGGMHFFNPVERMPLVEIIRAEKTSQGTVDQLMTLALKLGKTPIVVADRPGFLVNRLLVAYLNEACLIAEAGVHWQSLDHLALKFGMPMGPFRLIDEVGIDIAAEVGTTLCTAFSYLPESALLKTALLSGLKGKKGGKGFYIYRPGKPSQPHSSINGILGLTSARKASESDLRRLLLLMVNEAGRCLEEGVIADAADVDTGMVFGTGFPPFRGGLCRWAETEGIERVRKELANLADSLGERFRPCAYLQDKGKFY